MFLKTRNHVGLTPPFAMMYLYESDFSEFSDQINQRESTTLYVFLKFRKHNVKIQFRPDYSSCVCVYVF